MFCGIVNRISQTSLLSNCQIKAKDNSYFTIKCFDDSVHHFKVSQKNNPEATRKVRFLSALLCSPDRSVLCMFVCVIFQRWLEAIEEHSAFSTHYCSQDPDSEEEEDNVVSVHELSDSLQVRNDICILICWWSRILTITSADKMHMACPFFFL